MMMSVEEEGNIINKLAERERKKLKKILILQALVLVRVSEEYLICLVILLSSFSRNI